METQPLTRAEFESGVLFRYSKSPQTGSYCYSRKSKEVEYGTNYAAILKVTKIDNDGFEWQVDLPNHPVTGYITFDHCIAITKTED